MKIKTRSASSSVISGFRERLLAGITCISSSITLSDPHVTDALGDSVDFFWIDQEHSQISPESLSGHFLASKARQVPAIVRVSCSSTPFIKPVLDAGADGIIVPQVRSAEEVQQVVDDCRYPPVGLRGFGPRVPSNYGRENVNDYIERANRDLFVSVQIENVSALADLDDILSVEGLDSIVLGPWDLSASMGFLGEIEHPEVMEAMDIIIHKARSAGLFVGAGMGPDPIFAVKMIRRGVQWIQIGDDCGYMILAMNKIVSSIQSQLSNEI